MRTLTIGALLIAPVLVLAGSGCEPFESEQETAGRPDCDTSRQSPATVYQLVDVFRANGISLSVDDDCDTEDMHRPDATNGGSTGLRLDPAVERNEGHVLCSVRPSGARTVVLVNRYETDEETHLSVLNVTCSLYPSDAASEQRQVAGVKAALEALVREVRPPN